MYAGKQAKAKTEQAFSKQPMKCGNCFAFKVQTETVTHSLGSYEKIKSIRCAVGGFAVNRSNSCKEWRAKQ